jgi:hypothetical protein
MAHDPKSASTAVASALRTFRRPWPTLLAGLGCTVMGLLFSATPSYIPARVLFLGVGLLIAASAVARRLQTASWELEDRAESAGLLAMAAFVALLAFLGMDESWDSGRMFLGVLIAVALVGSFLVLLPRTGRRIVASVLVLLHFGGILTAITAVPPRNEPAPWLSMEIWINFYRNYLQFAYLTNAYHFYSPDPGPPTLLWYYVKYDDGSTRWIKLPNREESALGLNHARMLAAGEMTKNPGGIPLLTPNLVPEWEKRFGRKYELLPGIPHDTWDTILTRRRLGETLPYSQPIQLVRDTLEVSQYSEPQEIARRLVASYGRHIARTSPHPEHPEIPVKSVRIYQVTHNLISPRELAEGRVPTEETYYEAVYVGKYDRDGNLLDPKDPFLYWYLPIMKVPTIYPQQGAILTHPDWTGPMKLLNCVEIHANESDRVQKED